MSREIDKRDFRSSNVTAERAEELNALAAASSERLPADQTITITRLDPRTGNAEVISASASPAEEGNYAERALGFLEEINPALGFAPTQPVEFRVDPNLQRTHIGAVAVNAAQYYKGIKVFQASQKVRFDPKGAIQDTVGHTVTIADPVEVALQLSVTEAVQRAAEHVASPTPDEEGQLNQFGLLDSPPSVDLTGFQPMVIETAEDDPARASVLNAGPFAEEITANLLWFDLNGTLRLGWEVVTALPAHVAVYRTIVAADSGEILYCRDLVSSAVGHGKVFRVDPRQTIEPTDFPRRLSDYVSQYEVPTPPSPPLPLEFPDEWVTNDRTVGNSIEARHVTSGAPLLGTLGADNAVVFGPADIAGEDQQVLNMFYLACALHDVLYLLGFDEAAGNFQVDNFGRGGVGGDAVDATAHAVQLPKVATMLTRSDGRPPRMNLGNFDATGRHTALDSSVVFHEYTHGLTNRLVGGQTDEDSLAEPQSRGMGEGWSDCIPCVLNNNIVVGDWLLNNTNGIRAFPYNSDFPDNYGDIGTGRYVGEHAIGEIWAATLLEMNRNVGRIFGLQLVIDALKLTPANPSFLDGRDAILRGLDDMLADGRLTESDHAAKRRGIWEAFAKFGMGEGAQANLGPSLEGIVASFDLPADLSP